MQVFIEAPAGGKSKYVYDERTLVYKTRMPYAHVVPYHYGFIPNTLGGDGDNLDCFVLSRVPARGGSMMDVKVVGVVEFWDNGEVDHKILCVRRGDRMRVTSRIRTEVKEFLLHVFDNKPGRRVRVGRFLDGDSARAIVAQSQLAA